MIRKYLVWSLLICFAGLALGCGVAGQKVGIRPVVRTGGGNIGQGKSVGIKVTDMRPDQIIGYRDDYSKTAPIRVEGSLAEAVGVAVMRGLTEQGFNPGPIKPEDTRILNVEVRGLSYALASQAVTKKVKVKAVLKALAVNQNGNMDANFPVEIEREVLMTPGEDDNSKLINEAISDAVSMLVADQDLMRFLSKDVVKSTKLIEK